MLSSSARFCSWKPTKMLASTGPNGETKATPSVCLYMTSSKLNSTPEVTLRNNLAKNASVRQGGHGEMSEWYNSSAAMRIVLQWYVREKTLDVEEAHVSTLWHAANADGVVKLKAVLYHELAELRQHRL